MMYTSSKKFLEWDFVYPQICIFGYAAEKVNVQDLGKYLFALVYVHK